MNWFLVVWRFTCRFESIRQQNLTYRMPSCHHTKDLSSTLKYLPRNSFPPHTGAIYISLLPRVQWFRTIVSISAFLSQQYRPASWMEQTDRGSCPRIFTWQNSTVSTRTQVQGPL